MLIHFRLGRAITKLREDLNEAKQSGPNLTIELTVSHKSDHSVHLETFWEAILEYKVDPLNLNLHGCYSEDLVSIARFLAKKESNLTINLQITDLIDDLDSKQLNLLIKYFRKLDIKNIKLDESVGKSLFRKLDRELSNTTVTHPRFESQDAIMLPQQLALLNIVTLTESKNPFDSASTSFSSTESPVVTPPLFRFGLEQFVATSSASSPAQTTGLAFSSGSVAGATAASFASLSSPPASSAAVTPSMSPASSSNSMDTGDDDVQSALPLTRRVTLTPSG